MKIIGDDIFLTPEQSKLAGCPTVLKSWELNLEPAFEANHFKQVEARYAMLKSDELIPGQEAYATSLLIDSWRDEETLIRMAAELLIHNSELMLGADAH